MAYGRAMEPIGAGGARDECLRPDENLFWEGACGLDDGRDKGHGLNIERSSNLWNWEVIESYEDSKGRNRP